MLKRILDGNECAPLRDSRKRIGSFAPQQLIDIHEAVKAYVKPVGDLITRYGVDRQVDEGEFVAVVGGSRGRSTLINMITGIDKPTSGLVNFVAVSVYTLKEESMAERRGATLAKSSSASNCCPCFPAWKAFGQWVSATSIWGANERGCALYLLELVSIAENARRLPPEVCGGEQQRVVIAPAMA